MTEIKTRADLEIFASYLATNMNELPENLRLLVLVEPEDFNYLIREVTAPWAEMDQNQSDRFIYTSQSGIEFGIKQAT
jgi:hypothetical protein